MQPTRRFAHKRVDAEELAGELGLNMPPLSPPRISLRWFWRSLGGVHDLPDTVMASQTSFTFRCLGTKYLPPSHAICMALGLVCWLFCLPWNAWHRFLHSNDIACFRQILKIAENAVVELASAWGGMTSLVELEAQVRRAGGLAAENKDSANV